MSKKLNLFIDTAFDKCNLAVFDDTKIIRSFSCLTHNNLTDLVVEKVNNIVKNNEIKNVYITIGPGSFTGERVSCLIAKSWMLIKKVNVYIIDSLTFQFPKLNGISLIDARSNCWYACVYKNNHCLLKQCIISNNDFSQLKNKYKSLPLYKDYQRVDVFKNLFYHLKKFKKANTYEQIVPLYIKKPIYDQKN